MVAIYVKVKESIDDINQHGQKQNQGGGFFLADLSALRWSVRRQTRMRKVKSPPQIAGRTRDRGIQFSQLSSYDGLESYFIWPII